MRVLIAVTIINASISLAFASAGVFYPEAILPSHILVTASAKTFALYACSRALAIMGMVLFAAMRKNAAELRLLGLLAGIVQVFDAAVGLYQADAGKIIGPLVVGALQFWAIRRARADSLAA